MSFIDTLRAQLAVKVAERDEKQAALDAVLEAPTAEERDLNENETAEFRAAVDAVKAADEAINTFEARISELEKIEARKAEAAAKLIEVGATAPAKVINEPKAYRAEGGTSFFADAFAFEKGKATTDQRDRIERNRREFEVERRDVGTSAFGALVVPQYLTELYAEVLRAGRPFANAATSLPLPDEGMTINIPRGTTGTAVAEQTVENSNIQETDFDETTLAVSVKTIAGMQDVSRQSLERGRNVDAIIFADLAADYSVKVDTLCVNGTTIGALNQTGTNAVTFTDTTPTVGEFYSKLADAIQQVNSNRYMPATFIAMHPRRWGWITAALDTTERPLVVPQAGGPTNAAGVGSAAEYGQVVGHLHGLPVITDANIPTTLGSGTNEDAVIVARSSDLILMEEPGSPMQLRFEETNAGSLTVKAVVYGYVAWTCGRMPTGVSKITGAGLITPTF